MPKKLNGATETVSISMPGWLIDEIDAECSRKDFTRSNLVCRAIRKYLLCEKDSPELWEKLYRTGDGESC